MLVKYFAYYRDLTGHKQENIPVLSTVGELLMWICGKYGNVVREKLLSADGNSLGPDAIVLVNGRNIQHIGLLSAPLKPGDVISVFPLVAGG